MVDVTTKDEARIKSCLSEALIKAAVLNKFVKQKRLTVDSIIANEYPLLGLRVRADLAVSGKSFIGVEIKTAADTLRRLDKQMRAYQLIFDQTILVVASKHINGVDRNFYKWLEIWEIDEVGNIIVIQKPKRRTLSDAVCYKRFMTARDSKRFASSNCNRKAFLMSFQFKFAKTSRLFWEIISGRDIVPSDISLLSRFRPKREKAQLFSISQASRWDEWLASLANMAQQQRDQSVHSSSVSYSLVSSS